MERLERERERERDRDRERERERLHARERDMVHYDLNDEDLLNERSYGAEFTNRATVSGATGSVAAAAAAASGATGERVIIDRAERGPIERSSAVERGHGAILTHRHSEESELLRDGREGSSRYPGTSQPPQSSRRERDEYSPHRGGGNNRRVLNAM